MKHLTSLLLLSLPCLAADTPESIEKAASGSTPHLIAALEIADPDNESGKNMAALARQLAKHGFGSAPVMPPWARGDGDSGDRVKEDHRKEFAERVKQLGQEDLKLLRTLDSDQDLSLDAEEIDTAIRENLQAYLKDKLSVDKDGDQRLVITEYALAVPAKGDDRDEDGIDWHQRGHFEQADANKDGFLSVDEIMSHPASLTLRRSMLVHLVLTLDRADADKDGSLTENEFSTLSSKAAGLWKKASPDGAPIELARSYPTLFWLVPEDIEILLPQEP